MKLQIVPFNSVRAVVDVKTKEVFIGSRETIAPDIEGLLRHELAHGLSGDPDHGPAWQMLAQEEPPQPDLLQQHRKRYGIPSHIGANIGNIVGIQNVLTDLHLLAAYRKFSGKVLGTEGHFEVLNEVDGGPSQQLIRLYPTPKGVFPVVVLYLPVVTHFRTPTAKMMASEMLLAEAKCMVGAARRKMAGIPTPDGGSLMLDGEALAAEGREEKKEIINKAILLGEPLGIYPW